MFGYFADENKINEMYESFTRMAKQSGMNVQTFTFKGRPLKNSTIANNEQPNSDFLGNPVNKSSDKENRNNTQSNDKVDFFGNPIKNGQQIEKSNKTNPKDKVDFFGNPIKN